MSSCRRCELDMSTTADGVAVASAVTMQWPYVVDS